MSISEHIVNLMNVHSSQKGQNFLTTERILTNFFCLRADIMPWKVLCFKMSISEHIVNLMNVHWSQKGQNFLTTQRILTNFFLFESWYHALKSFVC